jgi:anti-anti-sigma factor
MQLLVDELPNGVTKAALVGRMDIDGAGAVDMRFNVLAGSASKLVVDLAGVSFLASMGLRTLMVCARSMASKGRKMAISGPQPNVEKVLRSSGMDEIVSIYPSFDVASSALAG